MLEAFIRDERPEVLVLKGRWGTGKTHLWNELVDGSRSSAGHKKYAYVSLFGVDSLEDVKNAIVIAMANVDVGREDRGIGEILHGLKALIPHAGKIPKAAEWGGALAGALAFWAVKDALICFDDLERRGSNLHISQVLGLASFLKDQRNCSVAIILNEDSLDASELAEFRQHGEKLADIDLKFARTVEEALDIGLRQEIPYREQAYERCKALGIDNIRIVRRVGRLIEGAEALLALCEPALVGGLIRSLVLFVWIYYDESGDSPSLSFVKGRSLESAFGRKRNELTPEEGKWVRLLEAYGYRYTDALDLGLIDYVERGYIVDFGSLVREIEAGNQEIRDAELNSAYAEVWELFHNSFLDNEDDFTGKLASFVRVNVNKTSPRKLNEIIVVLRALERDAQADELIDFFVERREEAEATTFSGDPYDNLISDDRLRSRLQEVIASRPETRDLGEVIRRITRTRSWHPDDIAFLSTRAVAEYVKFFRSEQSEVLPAMVKMCIDYLKHPGNEKLVGLKTEEALRQLAAESRINRLRLEKLYGITIGDSNGPEVASAAKDAQSGARLDE